MNYFLSKLSQFWKYQIAGWSFLCFVFGLVYESGELRERLAAAIAHHREAEVQMLRVGCCFSRSPSMAGNDYSAPESRIAPFIR